MKLQKKPEQIIDLQSKIIKCIEEERYVQSSHAIEREQERRIGLADAIYVLKTGYHEKAKTKFDEVHNTWKYAIRGKTVEGLNIRVIIAFYKEDMFIITVMHVLDK